jgi:hypothetical protein
MVLERAGGKCILRIDAQDPEEVAAIGSRFALCAYEDQGKANEMMNIEGAVFTSSFMLTSTF